MNFLRFFFVVFFFEGGRSGNRSNKKGLSIISAEIQRKSSVAQTWLLFFFPAFPILESFTLAFIQSFLIG